MLRSLSGARVLAALAVAALAAPFAAAQERGEEIKGFITSVDGRNLVVKHDDGREIRFSVTPSTEVYFQDSGDRKLFPNPGIDDLRAGLGVHFNYNGGNPTRVVVHFVPAGFQRGAPGDPAAPPASGSEQIKARIQGVDRLGRVITADVAGRSRKFDVESRRDAQGLRVGDMVVLTVENRAGRSVVTRIDSADMGGVVRRVDAGAGWVTIDVDGRDETFDVDNRKMLESLREGDRVRFEVEERSGGRRVVTDIQRRGIRDR